MSLCRDMMPEWELRKALDDREAELTTLRARVAETEGEFAALSNDLGLALLANDTLRARVAELEEALEQIAGCEPYMVGEWVIILARAALAKTGDK